ncbi:MAG TPA: carotenoid oxygenase, partial [Brevundimonas sp.]|nr:carotenoid oxygenase [Brevundimonas sp.]
WEEAGGTIRFDVCAHADMRFAATGATEILNGVPLGGEPARLALAVLSPDGSARLDRTTVVAEFPRSDPRRAGQPRRFSLHTAGESPDRPFATAIGLHDWSTGQAHQYDFGPDHVVEEMVVVPKPGQDAEDAAWLVGPTINLKDKVTELHVLDMARLSDGPVASWRSHTALPAGFHGIWAD